MYELTDKLLLFFLSLFIYLLHDYSIYAVIPAIITVLISCLSYYFDNQKVYILGCLFYAAICLFLPPYIIFLPFLLYDIILRKYQVFALITLFLFIINIRTYTLPYFLFTMLLLIIAFVLKTKTDKLNKLLNEYNELRDSSSSYSRLLEEKNRSILKNQDYEINLATLNERNRISKEIHDNIGHILSRAILQVGALLTITKDETVYEGLTELKNSLSSGMDDIRKSIHNMYDESVDLYTHIKQIINDFTFCPVYFDYDITTLPPVPLRYCFIAITKEALANIIKHSNATKVQVILREHPALYQLIIYDNGTLSEHKKAYIARYLENPDREGIGLRNISDRVKGFNGNLNISYDNGFRIFVTIPKTTKKPA